jgi:hypothetical protein
MTKRATKKHQAPVEHTAAPWCIQEPLNIYGTITIGTGTSLDAERVAEVFGAEKHITEANAKLIVHAPTLYNLLYDLDAEPWRLSDPDELEKTRYEIKILLALIAAPLHTQEGTL